MANGLSQLAQSMAPDILGSFERGRAQARQQQREQFADDELRARVERGNRLRQLAPQVLAAQDPQERQQLLSQLAGADPEAAMAMQQHEMQQQRFGAEQQKAGMNGQEWLGTYAARAKQNPDPAMRRQIMREALSIAAPNKIAEFDARNDEQLNQDIEKLSAFAPAIKPGDTPSQIQVYEYSERLLPEQRQRFLETVRAPQVKEIGGVPTIIVDGKPIPLSTLTAEQAAKLGLASAGAVGKGQGERTTVAIDNGMQAADAIAITRRGLELLNSVKTGGLDAAKLRATNLFGITGADEAELSANLGKSVLSQLRATFGAAFTEREGERLAQIEAGFGKSTEGNRRLLEQAEKILDRAARRGLQAAKTSGDDFAAQEIEQALKFTLSNQPPASTQANAPAPGAQPGGTNAPAASSLGAAPTATGPNGQKLILQNGQWIPLGG